MKEKRRHLVSFLVNDEELDYLNFLAKETGKSRGEIIREIIFEDLEDAYRGMIKYYPTSQTAIILKALENKLGIKKEKIIETIINSFIIFDSSQKILYTIRKT